MRSAGEEMLLPSVVYSTAALWSKLLRPDFTKILINHKQNEEPEQSAFGTVSGSSTGFRGKQRLLCPLRLIRMAHVKIPLTQGKFAIVDREDYPEVSKHKWHANECKPNYFIAATRIGKKRIKLHRFLLGLSDPNILVDHKNRNPLDNRRENLRYCTLSQNRANAAKKKAGPASKYKGVMASGSRFKPWRSRIIKNRKVYEVGFFKSEIEAARAYDMRAAELFGEFAYLNFPIESNCGLNLRAQR